MTNHFNFLFPEALKTKEVNRLQQIAIYPISEKYKIYLASHCLIISEKNYEGKIFEREINSHGMGVTKEEASFKCMMEMIEKASMTDTNFIRSMIKRKKDHGTFMPWTNFAPYSSEKISEIKRKKSTSQILVNCEGIVSGKNYVVPAECIFPYWGQYIDQKLFVEYDGSGTAAGFKHDKQKIVMRALSEVLERDALLLSWRLPGWHCQALSTKLLDQKIQCYLKGKKMHFYLYDIGDPALKPVILVILSNKSQNRIACGSACDSNIKQAVLKASLEALMVWYGVTRSVRLFRDSKLGYPKTTLEHLIYGYRHGEQILTWYDKLASSKTHPSNHPLSTGLIRRCQDVFGHEPLLFRCNSDYVNNTPYRVCRVLQPHAYRKEYSSQKLFLGGQRLKHFTQGHIRKTPHPFG